jgi:hypothetical protein
LSNRSQPLPVGHVLVPATAIGALSILLVVGLSVLHLMDRVDMTISQLVTQGEAAPFPKALPEWAVWLAAVVFAFGLSFAVLHVPGTWRRLILWISTLFIIGGWAPVLSLAAHAPDIGAPFIAALWSGICALVYANNHQMPCDEMSSLAERFSPSD